MTARATVVLLAPLLAAACVSAPEIAPPSAPPTAWTETDAPPAAARTDAWWRVATDDAVLQSLLDRAGAVETVAAARARQTQATQQARAARAGLLPSLSANASQSAAAERNGPGVAQSSGGVALALPLDLSGALRGRSGAAAARAAASAADVADARVQARRLAGELYITLRIAQAQRIAAERAFAAAADSYALAESRAAAGLETGLGVAQARSARDAARARVPGFAQSETTARLGLEALLGARPGELTALFAAPAAPPALRARSLLQTPAATLADRPDLIAAAARLKAAGLDARAARGDLWPSIDVQALATGVDASREPVGSTVSIVGSVAAPLFNFGRLNALAKAAGAGAEAEGALYRQAVRDAIADVETAVARIARAEESVAAQAAALASAQDQVALARARYTSGLTAFLDVLTAERSAYDAESALASAQGEFALANVALAAAMGLGQAA
ncbi:MAG: TolC family protein [Hyphomonadaceae bacterium]|nr:TolC family protein [Hyphomonadaceae bacterium]